jgi:hypothetical protein
VTGYFVTEIRGHGFGDELPEMVPAVGLSGPFDADVMDRTPDDLRIGTPLGGTVTSARQKRKWAREAASSGLTRVLCGGLGLAAILILGMPSFPRAVAATTERVVHDTHTGLAINGVDPVAYFTDAAPLVGLPENEYLYAGVVWRFRNEGNRAAFMANPEIYMPRFGGYDAVAIGRALALPGNPQLWAIVGERLYLFYSEDARARFMTKPDDAIALADNKWPALIDTLVN